MVLDALIKIKNEMDSTLTFRRSCREGKHFLPCQAPRTYVLVPERAAQSRQRYLENSCRALPADLAAHCTSFSWVKGLEILTGTSSGF